MKNTETPIPTPGELQRTEEMAEQERRAEQPELCNLCEEPLRDLLLHILKSDGCYLDFYKMRKIISTGPIEVKKAIYKVNLDMLLDRLRPEFEAAGWTIYTENTTNPPGVGIYVKPKKDEEQPS